MENGAKMDPKREPTSRKIQKKLAKHNAEIRHQKMAHVGTTPGKWGGGKGGLYYVLNTRRQQTDSIKHRK